MRFYFFLVFAMVLDADESVWDFPKKDLEGVEKVAIYRGSFDPLHKGHESIIEECLKNGISHVFLLPAFGLGEKDRSSLKIRTVMLEALVNNKTVSLLSFDIGPDMEADRDELKAVRKKVIDWVIALQNRGVKVYKVLGGDAAYKEIIALPNKELNVVNGYILASRDQYPITEELCRKFEELDAQVILIEPDFQDFSSSLIRNQIKNGHAVDQYISDSTCKIIQKYGLYKEET